MRGVRYRAPRGGKNRLKNAFKQNNRRHTAEASKPLLESFADALVIKISRGTQLQGGGMLRHLLQHICAIRVLVDQ